MSEIKYGVLHCHTEFSVKDSALKINTLLDTAKELGAPAVALTDHGVLTGVYDFMAVAKARGIKAIPGIETYFYPDEDECYESTRDHLILMAKDAAGYQAISRAETDGYKHSYYAKQTKTNYSRMSFDSLRRFFGPGTKGHGHVIATSACAGGVLARVLRGNELLEEEMDKLAAKRRKYRPVDDDFLDLLKITQDIDKHLDTLVKRREELTAAAKVTVTGLKRRLKTLDAESEEYKALEKEIEDKLAAKEKATEELTKVKGDIKNVKTKKTEYGKKLKTMRESIDKWEAESEKIEQVRRRIKDKASLRDEAVRYSQQFVEIFGEGNFYIELQYHGIQSEAETMPILAEIAKELNIPVVAANDIHYATNKPSDIRARTLIAAMRFNQTIEENAHEEEGYGELYMKTDAELKDALSKILDADTVNQAMENIGVIVDTCEVEIPYGEHYPAFVGCENGETTAERLRRLAEKGIPEKYPGDKWTKQHEDRMNYELDIINSLGYSDYLCIVQDYLEYGRSLGYDNPEKLGYTIGPGRGSAVGSIVCYLSGITSVDPIKYGLLFERFLNPERVSMPDIDSDFAPSIRSKVIDYVKNKYGEDAVCNIITKGTLAGKGAIKAVARVTDIPLSVADEVAKKVPSVPNATIDSSKELMEYCKTNAVAAQLVEDAKMVEGTVVNYGMHAAGVIISDNGDVGEYAPLMYNMEKEQWVIQCDMGQCEANAGLLKMDFLGLKNLDIISDTLRRIKNNRGISIDIEKVPMEEEVFKEIFSKGFTNGVFQFESGGMKSLLKRFKPSSMEDVILLVAAYRPGPMQYLDGIIASKSGKEKPKYIANGLKEILDPTYGYTIYQEQVMQIFNRVAGFSLGEADIVRKAMGKKKIKVLLDPKTNYHGRFVDGIVAAGASRDDAEKFWNELLDFASYAFNKSHAAAYAHISYYTAWLKYHYPAEYMCSLLSKTNYSEIPLLLNDCHEMGLQIKAPDINVSRQDFINVGKAVYFGFSSIKGVGNDGVLITEERSNNGPFLSMKDVVNRMTGGKSSNMGESAYITLIEAGAFDAFCGGNRQSIINGLKDFLEETKKLKKKTADLAEKEEKIKEDFGDEPNPDDKEYRKALRSVETCRKAVETLTNSFASWTFLPVNEDKDRKLRREHELLGFYVSGNPIDKYKSAIKKIPDVTKIINLDDAKTAKVCGIVNEVRHLNRKSDGKPFAVFTIFDVSGEIEVKCFTKEFEKFGHFITEGQALCIEGRVLTEEKGESIEQSMSVLSMKPIYVEHNEKIFICGKNVDLWYWSGDLSDELKRYRDDQNGYEIEIRCEDTKEIRVPKYKVSEEILNVKIEGVEITKRAHI